MHAPVLLCFYWLTILAITTGNYLKCSEGNNIKFKCPCCPEEFHDCRFKKLFQGGYIVRDGVLSDPTKYELDKDKRHIILIECNEDDEGTYVWMCGRCNVNKEFHVQVHRDSDEMLHCPAGGDISFERPCADELDSCRFMRNEQEGYIVRDGVLSDRHPRFEFDKQKAHITLRECNRDYAGTYVWLCRDCNKQFHLEVNENIEPLTCSVGNKVYFECPCCSEGLYTCRFKKIGQKGYIFTFDAPGYNYHHRFEFDKFMKRVILNGCHEEDKGTYIWSCERCKVNRHFVLRVHQADVKMRKELNKSTSCTVDMLSLISLVSISLINSSISLTIF